MYNLLLSLRNQIFQSISNHMIPTVLAIINTIIENCFIMQDKFFTQTLFIGLCENKKCIIDFRLLVNIINFYSFIRYLWILDLVGDFKTGFHYLKIFNGSKIMWVYCTVAVVFIGSMSFTEDFHSHSNNSRIVPIQWYNFYFFELIYLRFLSIEVRNFTK